MRRKLGGIMEKKEVIYRNGLRTALGLRSNVNNEILYVESGKYPLRWRILKQQLKFWLSVQNYCEKSPDSALKHFLDVAIRLQLPYVTWYKSLENTYGTPETFLPMLEAECRATWKNSFDETVDIDSRMGTYAQVNPALCTPAYINATMFETDRQLLTRFRFGPIRRQSKKGDMRIFRETKDCVLVALTFRPYCIASATVQLRDIYFKGRSLRHWAKCSWKMMYVF